MLRVGNEGMAGTNTGLSDVGVDSTVSVDLDFIEKGGRVG